MSQLWQLEIPAHLDNLKQVRDFIEDKALITGLCQEKIGNILIAVDEAISNVIIHGCSNTACIIQIKFHYNNQLCTIDILDNATLFNPLDIQPHQQIGSPLENNAPGGFGLSLIRTLINDVSYEVTSDQRNKLTFVQNY